MGTFSPKRFRRDDMTYRTPYPNELYHHGIKGQKWGVRRYQNKDGSLTKAGRSRYGLRRIKPLSEDERPKNRDYNKRSEEEQKTIDEIEKWNRKERLKLYKVQNLIAFKKLMTTKMSRILDDYDSKTKLPLKRESGSIEDDAKVINPQYKSTKASSSNNCELCTMAYDMRRRGFDVIARQNAPINMLYDIGSQDMKIIYKGAKEHKVANERDLYKSLKNQPNGSRGACFMSWDKNSGHVMAYEIINGRPKFIDAQDGMIHDNLKSYPSAPSNMSFMRLDTIEPN
jgi:hypothetical protein